jgi:signal transduction histidine kinase/CheY-like chemotaxis protein
MHTITERALILAPHGRDGPLAAAMLGEGGMAGDCCRDMAELARQIGAGVGFVVVAEEALAGADLQPLTARLEAQEPWSDIPFILLTRRGGGLERNPQARRDLTNLRNVTFLERPFHPTSLLSLATAALRARRRQYEARSRIAEISDRETALRESERALRNLAGELERRVEERSRLHAETVAQLHEAQKIETLGQLTGGVAHDFNNLLTPVIGALDMLGRIHPDARSQRLIRGALEASERSRTLISRLLAFARRQVLAASAVDVGRLVAGMADLIQRSLGPQIAMSLDLDRTTPPAWVDANQLELALLNLAVNARDAMPEGGELTISVKLGPGQHEDDPCVTLVVADTGMGMDATTLVRAIEPFFSTKSVGKGTGLGLSMVHGLAAQSGGKLTLSSQPGQGTRATLTLPVAAAAVPDEADAVVAADETMRPMRVLLVDDHELARDSTAAMLAEMGHAVTQCGSAEEALAVMGGARFDFVVSDYLMTGMTGSQLMDKVHEHTPDLPFALISGFAPGEGGFADGEEGGRAVKLLAKPFTRTELARVMLDSMRACAKGDPASFDPMIAP